MSITSFDGEYRFLSNFYPCDVWIKVHGESVLCPSVEHAFQALKTNDPAKRLEIIAAESASKAKYLGKSVLLRENWHEVKDSVMEKLVRQKFANLFLGNRLVATYPSELIEGNWWHDTYWGVCAGIGQNKLGIILMKVRDELIQKAEL